MPPKPPFLLPALAAALCAAAPAAAEVIVRGTEGAPLHEARPAPGAIFPDEHIVVAQPSPSEVNPSFLGPVLLMKSAHIDLEAGTMTVPLRRGQMASGETVWSVLTDVSDENLAHLHGVVYSAKMAYGVTGNGARTARIEKDGTFTFEAGRVDFSPEHSVTPGAAPNFFPPAAFQPGAVGDASYSPLVQFENAKNAVFNMPMVAFDVSEDDLNAMCDGAVDKARVHDKVVRICPRDGTVTLAMTLGYTFGKPIFYLSTEANDPLVATLEGAIHAPAMSDLPFALEDAAPGEAAERIYVFVNGPTGIDHPFRQGVNSALSDAGSHGPLNVLGGIPTINLDYSPIWRLFPVVWTEAAIAAGYRTKLTNAIDIENAGAKGIVESLAGGPPRAIGFLVNCPVVYRIN